MEMDIHLIPFLNQQELDITHTYTKKRRKINVSNDKSLLKSPEINQENDLRIKRTRREIWVKHRSRAWWEQCSSAEFPEDEFRKIFRMRKSTFKMICDELNSSLDKKNTPLRQAIPVQQRVAVCIWRLATGEPLRRVSEHFGLGIATCHKLILDVCLAIKTVFLPKFVVWPNESKAKENARNFKSITNIPSIVGSIYTSHIPIIAPKEYASDYLNTNHSLRNSKTSYTITIQGVVDPRGVFTDICIGLPGSMTTEKILEESALSQRAKTRGDLKGVWLVGNSGFPLTDWLIVPYTHKNLTWTQHLFNKKIKEAEIVSKDAFKRLKGRWICLQRRIEVKSQDLPVILGACCVLHNICEVMNEEIDEDLLRFDFFDDEIVPKDSVKSASSLQKRDHIAHNLLHSNQAGEIIL